MAEFKIGDVVELLEEIQVDGDKTLWRELLPSGFIFKFKKGTRFTVSDLIVEDSVHIKNYSVASDDFVFTIPEIRIGKKLIKQV